MPDPTELLIRGWQVLRLRSPALVADVVPALGGTVVSLRRRSDDLELLWQTPWGLRHRGSLDLPGTALVSMYDSYPGGWQPVFPNGGDSSIVHGAEWGFDGEARLTWLDWTLADDRLVLSGRLVRSPFRLSRTIDLRDDEVTVTDSVTNVGAEPVEVMWGQQVALGPALLGPDTVVQADAITVRSDPRAAHSAGYDDLLPWPRAYGRDGLVNLRHVGGADASETRLAYLSDLTAGAVSVRRPSLGLTVRLTWDEARWPHLWYALETGAAKGFPWFGTGRYLALTPCTSWPAHGLHDARRLSSLLACEPDVTLVGGLTVRVTD